MANPNAAAFARQMHPLRLSYSLFTSRNPFMQQAAKLAEEARRVRKPVSPDNPYWQMQEAVSQQIVTALKAFGDARDAMVEQMFFAFYGAPAVQTMLRMNEAQEPVRELPPVTPEQIAMLESRRYSCAAKLNTGTYDDALVRAVLGVIGANHSVKARTGTALNEARKSLMHLSFPEFQAIVKTQSEVLQRYGDQALQALTNLVPAEAKRRELMRTARTIVLAGAEASDAERQSLSDLAQTLSLEPTPAAKPVKPAPSQEETVRAAE
jgi:hypothetical protein